jgi:hypothetical protein
MGPARKRVRILVERAVQRTKQGRPRSAAVARPKHASQSFDADPRSAALVRDRQTPAADAIRLPFEHRPAHGAGAGDDDRAVPFSMGTDTGRVRVGGDDGGVERMPIGLRRRQMRRLAGSGHGQAGHDSRQVIARQISLSQAQRCGLDGSGKALLAAEAQIRRAGYGFAEDFTGGCGQPRPTIGPAAVDPEKKDLGSHAGSSCQTRRHRHVRTK